MKQVLQKRPVTSVVTLDEIQKDKIYLCKFGCGWAKAHRVENLYTFISLGGSECYMNGTFENLRKAIERTIGSYPIYEFDNWQEAAQYMVQNPHTN